MLSPSRAKTSVTATAVLLACLWLLVLQLHPRWGWFPAVHNPRLETPTGTEVVVASLKSEDTSWVHQYLSDWTRSVYVVDDAFARLTVPKNKGREAMVYLSHIIDNYDTLAPTTVFIHAARFAWHNDDPDYDGLANLRNLNFDHVQATGYANLRCVWTLGCPAEIRPHVDATEPAQRNNASDKAVTAKEIYKEAFEELMPGVPVPERVGVSCCSQFAVSRDAIRSRPREDYVRWRAWLLATPYSDDLSGRVFEYLWHIIFGKNSVFCPSAGDCYCKLYGLCGLKCDDAQCEGRYPWPKYATLPQGWPLVGWEGEERDFSGPL